MSILDSALRLFDPSLATRPYSNGYYSWRTKAQPVGGDRYRFYEYSDELGRPTLQIKGPVLTRKEVEKKFAAWEDRMKAVTTYQAGPEPYNYYKNVRPSRR